MLCDDQRLHDLKTWLEPQLPALCQAQGWPWPVAWDWQPASSDASFRRYFRRTLGEHSLILMDAPPPRENCAPFVRIAGLLARAGVRVPEILATDIPRGFLVLSDLGSQTFLEVISARNADELFGQAIRALVKLQQIPAETAALPAYDEVVLDRELQLFPEWYVQQHLGLSLDARQQQLWNDSCRLLLEAALAQPQVFVHRDYMPRNLMAGAVVPGVLDFQDALWGPVTYDITSLFKDAFVSWPEERVRHWQQQYWQQARLAGIPVPDDFAAFCRDSDLMGVQRHLKVIGIFARICHRDGKPRYLADVPRFFGYLHGVLARRPELAPLACLLDSLPLEGRA